MPRRPRGSSALPSRRNPIREEIRGVGALGGNVTQTVTFNDFRISGTVTVTGRGSLDLGGFLANAFRAAAMKGKTRTRRTK